MVYVTKWDGRREQFDREKIVKTIVRSGASIKTAEKIIDELEPNIYDGIPTKKIMDMVFKSLEQYEPSVAFRRDLRTALGEMKPFDFEEYVRILLQEDGYNMTSNRVIQGFCVTHEIDGIARKDGETIYLEVKNHRNTHTYTPFGVTLSAKAKWDDIQKGFEKGLNNTSFDRVLIVCNTRLTEHAKRYAKCIGLEHLGWNDPPGKGIDTLITEKHTYPITMLPSLSKKDHDKLSEAGIITLNHIVEGKLTNTGIRKSKLNKLADEAKRILST
jgi:Holliday junction resolvase-like predicted endonuclease